RAWLTRDLERVSATTPVVIFTHDPPESDPKNVGEGLLTDADPAAWEAFVAQHPNITAYFHGHNNWNEFYDWKGPRHSVVLHTFRADSPMKGLFSESDETKLSFQIATIDSASQKMTVREVLWNANPQTPNSPI